jgi:hypothetical protein
MKATELLLLVEYRQDITARNYGNKLIDRMRADHDLPSSFANKSEQEVAALKERFISDPALQNYILNKFEAADPTQNKQYTEWIVRRYIRGDYLLEDLEVVRRYLEKFIEAYRVIKQKNLSVDLNQYTLGTLKELIRSIYAVDATDNKQSEGLYPILPDTKVLYNGPEGQFVIPLTLSSSQALQKIGNEAEWCTADSRAPRYFPTYTAKGPLYIWIDRDGFKYQFHFPTQQFMDQNDRRLSNNYMIKFFRDNPITAPVLMSELENEKSIILSGIPKELRTYKMSMNAVKRNGIYFSQVPTEHRTPELALAAIMNHGGGMALRYIPRSERTEEICLKAIENSQEGEALSSVPSKIKTVDFLKRAVLNNSDTIQPITLRKIIEKIPVSEIDESFVKKLLRVHPRLIDTVPEKYLTEKVLISAVKKFPGTLLKIPKHLRTKNVYIAAVSKIARALDWLPKEYKNIEMYYHALNAPDGEFIFYILPTREIKSLPEDFTLRYIEKYPKMSLGRIHVSLRTINVCLQSLRNALKRLGPVTVYDELKKYVPKDIRSKVYDIIKPEIENYVYQ